MGTMLALWGCGAPGFRTEVREPTSHRVVISQLETQPIEHARGVRLYAPRNWAVLDLDESGAQTLPPTILEAHEDQALLLAWDERASGFPPFLTVSVMNMELPTYPNWIDELRSMLQEIYRQRFDTGDGVYHMESVRHIASYGTHSMEVRYQYRYDPKTILFVHELYLSSTGRTLLMTCVSPVASSEREEDPSWCLKAFQGARLIE